MAAPLIRDRPKFGIGNGSRSAAHHKRLALRPGHKAFALTSRFVRKERIASESNSIHAGQFSVNAVAPIARAALSRNARMFCITSRFVPFVRIVLRIEIDFARQIFR
jgi:hypothetical protein